MKITEDELYHYKAHVVSVYDGDTFRADVDLGFYANLDNVQFRLADIDTPELRGDEYEEGIIARDRVRELILDKDVILHTMKTGKYGRWIADVYIPDENGSIDFSRSLNELLLEEGLAEPYS